MVVAQKGIDIRQTGTKLLFRVALKDSTGAKLTTGTTTLMLYEYQSDDTFKSYDFNDNTFKATALTTATLSLTHRTGNNGTQTTGVWTGSLSTLTGFTAGAVYWVQVNNTGASPPDQEREFQYGGAEGDLLVTAGSTGQAYIDADTIKVNGTSQTARDLGLALPAVAPAANGGLPTVDANNNVHGVQPGTGTGQLNPSGGKVPATVASGDLNTADSPVFYTGTATSGAAGTLTDSGQTWTVNALAGTRVKIIGGTGSHQARVIVSNTATVLTPDRNWTTTPDATSVYAVVEGDSPKTDSSLRTDVGSMLGQVVTLDSNNVLNVSVKYWTGQLVPTPSNTGVPRTDPQYWASKTIPAANVDGVPLADVKDWNGVAVTGMPMPTYTQPTNFLAATFPSGTVANTTNITAGTITTATNLTNAPTAGDFTAAMKTSLNAATPVATLAAGAISDSTFTVPAESTTPPTGTVGKIHWSAARLGLRRVWDDVVGLVLSVFKSDGTTPQSVNNYTRKDDGTRDLAAALTGLTTSATYSLLLDPTTGRSTDSTAIIFNTTLAEAAAYGGFVGGGVHTIDLFASAGATLAIGYYGDGIGAYLATISGDPTQALVVKIDGAVVNPAYNTANHVGLVTLASGQARGPHLCEITWPGVAGGSVYIERLANGGSNPSFVVTDAGGNAKFLAPSGSGYGPIAYLAEVNYVRCLGDGGWEPVSYFNWNAVQDACPNAGGNGRGGIGSQIRATFIVPPGATTTLSIATFHGNYQLSRDDGKTYGKRVAASQGSNTVGFTALGVFGAGTHTVRVINDSTNGEGVSGNNAPVAIMLTAPAAFVTDPMSARPICLIYGDSEFLAWGTAASDAQATFLQQFSTYGVSVRSIGGSTVYDPTAPHNHVGFGMNDTANITTASTLPAIVFMPYGGNDTVATGADQVNFQNAVQQMISVPASVLTNTPFVILGIIPTGSQDLATRTLKNNLIKAAMAATGLTNLHFLDVEGWAIDPTIAGVHTVDKTHANRNGSTIQTAGILAWLGGDVQGYLAGQAAWAAGERTLTGAANITSTGGTITVTGGAVNVQSNADKTGYALTAAYDAAKTAAQATDLATLQTTVNNINNLSALAVMRVPVPLVRPTSGTVDYLFTVNFYDVEGHLEDLTSGSLTLTAKNAAGTDRSAGLSAVTHVATGVYTFLYTVRNIDVSPESLQFTATGTVAGAARFAFGSASVTDVDEGTAVAAIKAQTDKLTFNGSNHVLADLQEVVGSAALAALFSKWLSAGYSGSVTGAATLTTLIDANLPASDAKALKGRQIIFTTTVLAGEGATVSDYDPTLHKLTFRSNLTSIPQNAAQYVMPPV